MKKSIKSFLLVFVMLAVCVAPMLAGCAKTYTVTVSIEGGNFNGGQVTTSGSYHRESVYDKTAISEGEYCDYLINPFGGYKISAITIDGKAYDKSFREDGHQLKIKVEKDISIHVVFEKITYNIVLIAKKIQWNEALGEYEYLGPETFEYDLTVAHGDMLYLSEFGTLKSGDDMGKGVFYYYGKYGKTHVDPAKGIKVLSDAYTTLYTDLTVAELEAILADN